MDVAVQWKHEGQPRLYQNVKYIQPNGDWLEISDSTGGAWMYLNRDAILWVEKRAAARSAAIV